MKALTDAVSLWMRRFSFRVINIIDYQIQLVIVAIAILGPTISKHTPRSHRMLLEEGQHLIVKQLRGRERVFIVYNLVKATFA